MANRGKEILIVDDHADMVQTLRNIFAARGYAVDVATNGAEAVQRAEEKKYPVVLTDLVMEGLDGVDTIQRIKKISPNTLFFLMTAYPSEHRAQDAIESGVLRIFKKPFNIVKMCQFIDDEIAKVTS